MVNLDELRERSLRAYEIGRLVTASRVALLLVPVAAFCLLESAGREVCACLAFLLLTLAVWLRWRDRRGFESVTTGLWAGSFPLLAGLTLSALDLRCGLAGAESFCTAFSVLVGGAAGLFIAVRESRWPARLSSVVAAGSVAALAAGLGCVRLGVVGTASIVVGIALGALLGAAVTRRARA